MTPLSNSQGTVDACTVSGSGNDLTLIVTITPKAAFVSGTKKNVYQYGLDISNTNTGWKDKGDWTIN